MKRRIGVISLTLVSLLLIQLLGVGAANAEKDKDNDQNGPIVSDFIDGNVALDPDAFITDAQENKDAARAAAGGCTFHSVLTGPPADPGPNSFQLVQALPYDVSGNWALDTPASCTNGAKILSGLAWSSRHLASFQNSRGANLHYRVISRTYTHLYTGQTYNTRAVRRFRSDDVKGYWDATSMDGNFHPNRLDLLRDEMESRSPSWQMDTIGIKYSVMFHTETPPVEGTCNPTTKTCRYVAGLAMYNGPIGVAVRTYQNPYGSFGTIRYGCGSRGDAIFAHEATHQVAAVPGTSDRHSTSSNDLMYATVPYTITDSRLTWDGAPGYQSIVSGSSYVQSGALSGVTYDNCV